MVFIGSLRGLLAKTCAGPPQAQAPTQAQKAHEDRVAQNRHRSARDPPLERVSSRQHSHPRPQGHQHPHQEHQQHQERRQQRALPDSRCRKQEPGGLVDAWHDPEVLDVRRSVRALARAAYVQHVRFSDAAHCARFVAALGPVLARAWPMPTTPTSLCMSASSSSSMTMRPIPLPIPALAPAEAPIARSPPRARGLGGGTPVVSVYIPHPLERFAPSTTSPDLKSVLDALAAEPVQLRIRGACGAAVEGEGEGEGDVDVGDPASTSRDFGEQDAGLGMGEDGDGDGSFYEDTASFSAAHDASCLPPEPEESVRAPRARLGLGFSDAMQTPSSGASPASAPASASPPRQTLDLVALSVNLVSAAAGRAQDTAAHETQARTKTKTKTKTKTEDRPKPGESTGARSNGEGDTDADTTDVDASMAAQLAAALALLGALEPQSPPGPPPAPPARDVESVASTPDRPARARSRTRAVQPQPRPRPASHSQLPSQAPPQVKAHARQARAQRHSAAEPVKLRKMGSWVSGLFGEIQNLKGRERGAAGAGVVRVDGDKARG